MIEFFPKNQRLYIAGSSTFLEENKSYKPDITYKAKIGDDPMDFWVFEVKQPKAASKDDLEKVSLELQYMLNHFIFKDHNRQPVVYGVVARGHQSGIYRMELVAPCVYILTKLRSFYFPRSLKDLEVLQGAIPALLQLKQLVLDRINSDLSSIF